MAAELSLPSLLRGHRYCPVSEEHQSDGGACEWEVWLGSRTGEVVVKHVYLPLTASPKAHGSSSLGWKLRRYSRSLGVAHSTPACLSLSS